MLSDRSVWSRVDGPAVQGGVDVSTPKSNVSQYGTSARNTMRVTPAGVRNDEHADHWEKKKIPPDAEGLPAGPPGLVW